MHKEVNVGGNTYKNRKSATDDELRILASNAVNYPLKALYSDKVYFSKKEWNAHIPRFLDKESCRRFHFLVETYHITPTCAYCRSNLGYDSFHHYSGFSKYCPTCKSLEIWKSTYTSEKLAQRGEKITKSKLEFYQTEKGKRAAKIIGEKNSALLKEFYQTEKGAKAKEKARIVNRKSMKERILLGVFTPNSNNRNTHWDSYYLDKKYRSSWEALYQYFYPTDEHEKLRILYNYKGKEYVYIVDFINYNTRTVTEVKPAELCSDEKFIAKYTALEQWAKLNNFVVRIANQDFFKSHPQPENLNDFDECTKKKILKLYAQIKN